MLSSLIVTEKLLPMPLKILILAGTKDARLLANRLVRDGHDVTSSFAGVTEHPVLPEGKIRKGGFGGADGIRKFIIDEKIDVLVDATHPFAAVISRNAAEAHPQVLRLERAAWAALTTDLWINVADIATAVAALPFEARVMLTIGRKEVMAFTSRPDLSGAARMIEPPAQPLPANWQLILERPPFDVASETILLRQHDVTHLVCKNAGGRETVAKLEAARNLGLPVVMIARPHKPDVETFASVDAIAAYISLD
jgi:precorrin-6A/cobalt-precorrin-6A reductase